MTICGILVYSELIGWEGCLISPFIEFIDVHITVSWANFPLWFVSAKLYY